MYNSVECPASGAKLRSNYSLVSKKTNQLLPNHADLHDAFGIDVDVDTPDTGHGTVQVARGGVEPKSEGELSESLLPAVPRSAEAVGGAPAAEEGPSLTRRAVEALAVLVTTTATACEVNGVVVVWALTGAGCWVSMTPCRPNENSAVTSSNNSGIACHVLATVPQPSSDLSNTIRYNTKSE